MNGEMWPHPSPGVHMDWSVQAGRVTWTRTHTGFGLPDAAQGDLIEGPDGRPWLIDRVEREGGRVVSISAKAAVN